MQIESNSNGALGLQQSLHQGGGIELESDDKTLKRGASAEFRRMSELCGWSERVDSFAKTMLRSCDIHKSTRDRMREKTLCYIE
jgi:hypothetical protein